MRDGIRCATSRDVDGMLEIYAPIVRSTSISFEYEPPTPLELEKRLRMGSATHPWLVYEERESLLAFAYATQFRARQAYAWCAETTIYVREEVRRKGIARHLYGTLLGALKAQGFRMAYGVIALPNPASEEFHRATGFALAGRLRSAGHKLGAWHDIALYERVLAELPEPPLPPRHPDEIKDEWTQLGIQVPD